MQNGLCFETIFGKFSKLEEEASIVAPILAKIHRFRNLYWRLSRDTNYIAIIKETSLLENNHLKGHACNFYSATSIDLVSTYVAFTGLFFMPHVINTMRSL